MLSIRPCELVHSAYHVAQTTQKFLRFLKVAANEQDYCEKNSTSHCDIAAEVKSVRNEITSDESCASRDEPTADDAQNASDAEYSALTTPSAVGKALRVFDLFQFQETTAFLPVPSFAINLS